MSFLISILRNNSKRVHYRLKLKTLKLRRKKGNDKNNIN
jgi:hypothetical protein